FPGTAHWVNIPYAATGACVQAICQRVSANIGPDNDVWLEYANENWDGVFPNFPYLFTLSRLWSYLPSGTPLAHYYTTTGSPPPFDRYGPATILTGYYQDVFIAEWIALGNDPSRVKRIQGSAYSDTSRSQQIIAGTQMWGIPVDLVDIALYQDIPGD